MAGPSPAEYAQSTDGYVANRVASDWFGHDVEEMWSAASPYRPILERLASFSRLITFDQRGVGLSDPVPLDRLPTLEEWMDDLRAVLDACGRDRVALVTKGAGGALGMLFAASYPDRVSSLALVNSYARLLRDDDYPFGLPAQRVDKLIDDVYLPRGSAHDLAGGELDDATAAWMDRYLRVSASPSTTAAMRRMLFSVDLRNVLPNIHAPTLVVHRRDNGWIRVGHGRYLAEHITGAGYVELPGASDLWFGGDPADILDEIEEFLTGERAAAAADRMLATVLFTDLVSSTEQAARLGDRTWRTRLDQHERIVREELRRYRGREVKTTGDGFLATFDGLARAIRCAHAIRQRLAAAGLDVRSGIHTGEIELRGDDVAGIAVHIAARVEACAGPGDVLVSRTVKDLVAGSGIEFDERGAYTLKGVPERWELYAARASA